jgi:hypothetical protein
VLIYSISPLKSLKRQARCFKGKIQDLRSLLVIITVKGEMGSWYRS